MKKWIKLLSVDLLTVALGASLTLAFAPYSIFPLAVLAFTGLILALQGATRGRATWLGYLFGLGFFGTGVNWVYTSIHDIGQIPTPIAITITGGMIAFLALYPAVACYFTARFFPATSNKSFPFAFPSIWCLTEIARSWLFSGFPWLLIGYSQTNSPLSGFAPIFSVYGVSLAVLLSAGLIAYLIQQLKLKQYKTMYFSLLGVAMIWTAGSLLSLITWTAPEGKPATVSLIQGNIPQEMKWSPENLQLSLDTYANMTTPLLGKRDLIIWPEAAIPLTIQDARSYINNLDAKAKKSGSHLILGIPMQASMQKGYYNAVVTLGSDKNVYLKRHLVPFGEYSPLQNEPYLANALKLVNIALPDMIPGELNQEPFTVDHIKIMTFICYEIAFPQLVTSFDRNIGVLLTVTNDAWFGKSIAQAQHLQMAQMRSQELRRPSLFVSNDGITAIISPKGTIEAAAPPHERAILSGTIQPMLGMTPWMRNHTDPVLIIMLCMLYFSAKTKRRLAKSTSLPK